MGAAVFGKRSLPHGGGRCECALCQVNGRHWEGGSAEGLAGTCVTRAYVTQAVGSPAERVERQGKPSWWGNGRSPCRTNMEVKGLKASVWPQK